ncbi:MULTISPECIES: hypothetical protein [unclassified Bartonella]|uniref:hypothetical protein n=1 Tax=unclassified Bartonella TaxID=2645622 RepID=UPI0035D0E4E5
MVGKGSLLQAIRLVFSALFANRCGMVAVLGGVLWSLGGKLFLRTGRGIVDWYSAVVI